VSGQAHSARPDTGAGSRRLGDPSDRRLLGLTWAHLLNDGATNYLPGVLPAVLASLHQPVRLAGVLIAALTIGQVLQPVLGWVADRMGGRSLILVGLLFTSVGGGLLGVVHTTGTMVVLLLLIGVGGALFHPQALAGVRNLLAGRQGVRTSVFLVGGELGRGLWPTVASVITANFGLTYLWIIAVPGLVTLPFLARWAPRLPRAPKQQASIAWRQRLGPLMLLIGYRCVRAFTVLGLSTFIPIIWHIRGESLVTGASVITTMVAVGVVGNLGGGHMADTLGRRPVLIISALATGALIFPVIYLHGPVVWVAAAFLGMALFLTASTTVLIGQDLFPENRSMGSGIALGFANGIGSVLVLITGFVVADTNLQAVFWILAVLAFLSAAGTLLFPARLMRRHNQ
jgi:FSR family fosmidomycin resistance protein-like MFS transporter